MSIWQRIQEYQQTLDATVGHCFAGTNWQTLHTIEMHTAGEPLRVILKGYPKIPGQSVWEKRSYLRQNYDQLRKLLIWEPRGHADMYGCLLVEPELPDSDCGVIFLHNEGYSTMCGHAIIAISKLVFLMGWRQLQPGENRLRLEAPCGVITSRTEQVNGQPGRVSFDCVPSFAAGLDRVVDVPYLGPVHYDLGFGGAFYAYVDIRRNSWELPLESRHCERIRDVGMQIKQAIQKNDPEIEHPVNEAMNFLYGTIFIDDACHAEVHSRNVCVFADGEVDRSPTGSGVAGRLAIHYARNEISIGEEIEIESILGTRFSGSIIESAHVGLLPAVIPRVTGTAHVTGRNQFWLDPTDPLPTGFLLR